MTVVSRYRSETQECVYRAPPLFRGIGVVPRSITLPSLGMEAFFLEMNGFFRDRYSIRRKVKSLHHGATEDHGEKLELGFNHQDTEDT